MNIKEKKKNQIETKTIINNARVFFFFKYKISSLNLSCLYCSVLYLNLKSLLIYNNKYSINNSTRYSIFQHFTKFFKIVHVSFKKNCLLIPTSKQLNYLHTKKKNNWTHWLLNMIKTNNKSWKEKNHRKSRGRCWKLLIRVKRHELGVPFIYRKSFISLRVEYLYILIYLYSLNVT